MMFSINIGQNTTGSRLLFPFNSLKRRDCLYYVWLTRRN